MFIRLLIFFAWIFRFLTYYPPSFSVVMKILPQEEAKGYLFQKKISIYFDKILNKKGFGMQIEYCNAYCTVQFVEYCHLICIRRPQKIGGDQMQKKYIIFNDPKIYAIYYRAAGIIYYNLTFAAYTKIYVFK